MHIYNSPSTGPKEDIQRIINSPFYKRLNSKTQVFSGPLSQLHGNRLTHTLETRDIALLLAEKFGADKDLVEAGTLGHDMGHSCYGHAGERGSRLDHKVFGYLQGELLGLTEPTKQIILLHSNGRDVLSAKGLTLGEAIGRIADKEAYILQDHDDALRIGKLQRSLVREFGETYQDRVKTLVDAVEQDGEELTFNNSVAKKFNEIRNEMFEKVYKNPSLNEHLLEERIGVIYNFLREALPEIETKYLVGVMSDFEADYIYREIKIDPGNLMQNLDNFELCHIARSLTKFTQ